MRQFLLRLAVALTANRHSQKCLRRGVHFADYLMGVGSGSKVKVSGEASVLKRVRETSEGQKIVVFDVGSNKGQFLLSTTGALAERRHEVHCFEPSVVAYDWLATAAAGLDQVRLNNFGLGREAGKFPLFSDRPGSRIASLTKRRVDHFGVRFNLAENVLIETLDKYCACHAVDRIDLLKIDVEGHEFDVLAGSIGMLLRRAIRFISFEFGGTNIDTRTFFQDFYYFFKFYDMRIARIVPGGFWFELNDYDEIYEQFRTTNFVAYQSADAGAEDGRFHRPIASRSKRRA